MKLNIPQFIFIFPRFVSPVNILQPTVKQSTATFKARAATVAVVQRHIYDCFQCCIVRANLPRNHSLLGFHVLKKSEQAF